MTPEIIHWIPVTDRLPDLGVAVLIHCPYWDDPVDIGHRDDEGNFVNYGVPVEPTHWAELPAGPDAGDNPAKRQPAAPLAA